jgi:MarR family transcriptional regulator, organic hydroperoxide resistance regulator
MNDGRHIPVPPPVHLETDDPVAAGAFQALGRIFHLHRQAMQRLFAHTETHHGAVFVLRLLARNDGMSQRDLADTLHLSRPRVTSILQGLEREGAVRREADTEDQRVTRVFLTEAGRRQEMEHREAFEKYLETTIGVLSEQDKKDLARILDQVSGHISEMLGAGAKEQEGGEKK